jgi:O-antigen/teichoic acid export membrane protein
LLVRFSVISESIQTWILPRVAAHEKGHPELVAQCARFTGIVTGLLLLTVVAISVPLVRILLSAAFLDAVPLIWIMAPGIFLANTSQVLFAFFRGLGQPGICSYTVWAGLLSKALAFWVLYPVIGLPAAAWALTIGYLVRTIALVLVFRHKSGQSLRQTWLIRRDDVLFAWSFVYSLLGRFLRVPRPPMLG